MLKKQVKTNKNKHLVTSIVIAGCFSVSQ